MASNEDLKLSDMLRYYMRDSQAAKARDGPRASLRAGGQGAEPPGAGRQARAMGQGSCALAGPRTAVLAAAGSGRLQECQQGAGQGPHHQPGVGYGEPSTLCLSDSARQAKPRAPRALPLHGPPCQGRHCSPPELMDFKSHGSSFHENLTELGELELKHAKVSPPASQSPLAVFLASHPGSLVSWHLGAGVELVGVGGVGWHKHPSCAGPGFPVLTRTLPFSSVARPQ